MVQSHLIVVFSTLGGILSDHVTYKGFLQSLYFFAPNTTPIMVLKVPEGGLYYDIKEREGKHTEYVG